MSADRSPLARVMPQEALVAGSGPSPRRLAHPVVLAVDIDAGVPADPFMHVRLSWQVHPALRRWLLDDGAAETSEGLRPGSLAALQAAAPDAVAARPSRARGPRLQLVGKVLRTQGPALPATVPAHALPDILSRFPRVPAVGTAAWVKVAASLQRCLVATVDAADITRVRVGLIGEQASCDALQAMAALERSHLTCPVAADPDSVDLAELHLAAGWDRPLLEPAQDLAVSQLRSTQVGAVLAHPPGSGKTVIACSALQEEPDRRTAVLAPAAVLRQWRDELAAWSPSRSILLASRAADLPAVVDPGQVVVTSWDVGWAWLEQSPPGTVDDLVVDEAAVLLAASRRSRGLWAARQRVQRAWALTGTPEERHGAADAAHLAAWARCGSPESVPARAPRDLAPVVLLPGSEASIPQVRVETLEVQPSAAEQEYLDELAARTGAAATAFDRARMGDLARRGLGDRLSLGSAGPWGKRDRVVQSLVAHVAAGRAALLCTDSVPVAEEYVGSLVAHGVAAATLASSLSTGARARLLSGFASGEVPVLVVTPSSQRGVNLQRADLVIHADLPASMALFEQRNARAARMGSMHAEVTALVPVLAGTWDARWTRAFIGGESRDPLDCVAGGLL